MPTIPQLRFFKLLVCIYFGVSLLVIAFNGFFYFNDAFRKAYVLKSFAINKDIEKVSAKVIGYDYSASRSRKSGSQYSYRYGFIYTMNNKTYFGSSMAVKHVGPSYSDYSPLPKSIDIHVDKKDNSHFIYSGTYYGFENFFNFFNLLWVAVLATAPFGIKYLKSDIAKQEAEKTSTTSLEAKARTKFETIKWHTQLLAYAAAALWPIAVNGKLAIEFINGRFSENISGFEALHNSPASVHAKGTYRNINIEYGSGDSHTLYL
jgi:hypothetical protein